MLCSVASGKNQSYFHFLLSGDSKEDIVIKDDKLDKKKKTDGVSNVEEPPIKKSRVIEEVTSNSCVLRVIC